MGSATLSTAPPTVFPPGSMPHLRGNPIFDCTRAGTRQSAGVGNLPDQAPRAPAGRTPTATTRRSPPGGAVSCRLRFPPSLVAGWVGPTPHAARPVPGAPFFKWPRRFVHPPGRPPGRARCNFSRRPGVVAACLSSSPSLARCAARPPGRRVGAQKRWAASQTRGPFSLRGSAPARSQVAVLGWGRLVVGRATFFPPRPGNPLLA